MDRVLISFLRGCYYFLPQVHQPEGASPSCPPRGDRLAVSALPFPCQGTGFHDFCFALGHGCGGSGRGSRTTLVQVSRTKESCYFSAESPNYPYCPNEFAPNEKSRVKRPSEKSLKILTLARLHRQWWSKDTARIFLTRPRGPAAPVYRRRYAGVSNRMACGPSHAAFAFPQGAL